MKLMLIPRSRVQTITNHWTAQHLDALHLSWSFLLLRITPGHLDALHLSTCTCRKAFSLLRTTAFGIWNTLKVSKHSVSKTLPTSSPNLSYIQISGPQILKDKSCNPWVTAKHTKVSFDLALPHFKSLNRPTGNGARPGSHPQPYFPISCASEYRYAFFETWAPCIRPCWRKRCAVVRHAAFGNLSPQHHAMLVLLLLTYSCVMRMEPQQHAHGAKMDGKDHRGTYN